MYWTYLRQKYDLPLIRQFQTKVCYEERSLIACKQDFLWWNQNLMRSIAGHSNTNSSVRCLSHKYKTMRKLSGHNLKIDCRREWDTCRGQRIIQRILTHGRTFYVSLTTHYWSQLVVLHPSICRCYTVPWMGYRLPAGAHRHTGKTDGWYVRVASFVSVETSDPAIFQLVDKSFDLISKIMLIKGEWWLLSL
jgi:hypothetical protein